MSEISELKNTIEELISINKRMLANQDDAKQRREKRDTEHSIRDARREREEAIHEIVRKNPDKFKEETKNGELILKEKTIIGQITDAVDDAAKIFNSLTNSANNFFNWIGKSWGEAQDGASQYAKAIGMSADAMANLRKTTIDFVADNNIGANFNVSMKELLKLQQSYNQQLGRSVSLTGEQLANIAAMKALVGEEQTIKFTASFEKFGLDANVASKELSKMFNNAQKKGLTFQKYSENFLNNIDLAQRYTFADGVRGLASMAEKATAIKLDLQQTAAFAEKVNTVEGAIKTGANLSVLGGPFARYGNPMGMLYESLNDLEGLQDRMINMFSNLGRWDAQKGQVDISAFNRMRIRAASQAMGIDYGKAIESINAQGRRNEVAKQLRGRTDLDEETKELILNTAQINKEGNAYVSFNGKEVSVREIGNQQRNELKKITQTQAQDIKDIAQMLRGWTDSVEGRNKQYQAVQAKFLETNRIGERAQTVNNWFGENGKLLTAFLYTNMGLTIGQNLSKVADFLDIKWKTINGPIPKGGSTATPPIGNGGNLPPISGGNLGGGNTAVPSAGKGRNTVFASSVGGNISTMPLNRTETPQISRKTSSRNLHYYSDQEKANAALNKRYGIRKGTHGGEVIFDRKTGKPIKNSQLRQQALNDINNPSWWARNKGRLKPSLKFSPKMGVNGALYGSLAASAIDSLGGNRDDAWGSVARVGSSAVQWAGIGAMFGGVGALVGGALGAVYGGIKEYNNYQKNKLYQELYDKGIGLRGSDYTIDELNKILKGKVGIGGEGSKLHRKMEQNGDGWAYNQLGLNSAQKLAGGGLIVGPSHSQGGVAVGNSNINVEGGEFVVKKEATAKNIDTLQAINADKIVSTEPMGKQMKVAESTSPSSVGNIGPQKIEIDPIKFDITGNINLNLGNNSTQIEGKDLLNNPEFIRQITNVITKRINQIENKSFVKDKYWRKMD